MKGRLTGNWKRFFLAIVLLITVIRIFYIVVGGEIEKESYTSALISLESAEPVPCSDIVQKFRGTGTRLNILELYFDEVTDVNGAVILQIKEEDTLIYQTDLSLGNIQSSSWKMIYINCPFEENKEYTLTINASDDCVNVPTTVLVDKDAASPETISTEVEGVTSDKQLAVLFGYQKAPGRMDRLVSAFICVCISAIVILMILFWDEICRKVLAIYSGITKHVKPNALWVFTEIAICFIIINNSGIVFQTATMAVLYIISFCCAYNGEQKCRRVFQILDKPYKKVLLGVAYFYTAFAFVGQRVFIYPLNERLHLQSLFVFLVTVLWSVSIVNSILVWMSEIEARFLWKKTEPADTESAKARKCNTIVFSAISIVLLIFPTLLNLYANNPGISSPDTVTTMATSAHTMYDLSNWHSFFYVFVLHLLEKIWDSTYMVIFFQYFFWVYVVLEMLLFLRKKNVRDGILLAVALFLGTNAANMLHLNTIWKDIPYTLSVLWVFVILARLVIGEETYRKKWFIYIELILAMTGAFLYRRNGFVTIVLVMAAMIIFMVRKYPRLILSMVATIVAVCLIQGPLYDHYRVQDTGRYGIYIGLSQDILGVYYAGGEVSADTVEMITVMTSHNVGEYGYTPTYAWQSYDLDVPMSEFIYNYLDTFIHNPVTMIKAVIAREDAIWNIYDGEDAVLGCVDYYGATDADGVWISYYPTRQFNSLYEPMKDYTDYTASSQWIGAIEWRSGVSVLLSLLVLLYLILGEASPGSLVVLISPVIGHVLSLLLSCGWSEFRYYWILNLISVFFLLSAFLLKRENQYAAKQSTGSSTFPSDGTTE